VRAGTAVIPTGWERSESRPVIRPHADPSPLRGARGFQPATFPERVLGTMRCLCGGYHYVDRDGVVADGVCWAERDARKDRA